MNYPQILKFPVCFKCFENEADIGIEMLVVEKAPIFQRCAICQKFCPLEYELIELRVEVSNHQLNADKVVFNVV